MAAVNIERVVGNAIIELIRSQPFYGSILSQLPRRFTPATPTLAVGRQPGEFLITLFVNPAYVEAIYAKAKDSNAAFYHLVEVLKHETLHIVFEHPFKKPAPDPEAQTMAMECAVNSYIERDALLDEGVFPDDFGLPPRLGYDRYYAALAKHLEKERKKAARNGGKTSPAGNGGNAEAGAPGGDSGNNSPAQPEPVAAGGKPAGNAEFPGGGRMLDDHAFWKDLIEDGENGAGHLLATDILRKAREAAKDSATWGSVPGDIRAGLDSILDAAPPKVAWQSVLRDFAASSSESALDYTNRRVSRRFGTRPGTYKQTLLNLAVGVDTSGSIDAEALKEFFTELAELARGGAEITVFECDCRIKREYPFAQFDPANIKGGGGTDLEPVFKIASARRFDALVYFTDGYAPEIATDYRIPTILVIKNNTLHRRSGGFVYPFADFAFFLRNGGEVEVE